MRDDDRYDPSPDDEGFYEDDLDGEDGGPEMEGLEGALAVVGMAGRFPGASSPEELWRNLRQGVESISFFTREELLASGLPPSLIDSPGFVGAAGVLEGADLFDGAYFGFTPRESEVLDPQHRLFLETAVHALENAGYDPARPPGRIALFGGSGIPGYMLSNLLPYPSLLAEMGQLQVLMLNQSDFLCTRVSYKLDLRGPSSLVQTACSTSLVATHFACQSLLAGESDMALAGGVSLSLPIKQGYVYQEGSVLSEDGHCRAFDRRATGTVRGSGVGLVVIKRLEDALADGDSIRALIRGSAMNNDGATKVGFTAPSVDCQSEVIAEALSISGVDPDTISYVEAHGSGTSLGDPIEIAALTRAYRHSGAEGVGTCRVGSVKTNVGHLDAAAGVTGLIKTVLALQHGEIPPSLNFEEPNPEIDFASGPFQVARELTPWERNGEPRRAGVSSFGLGGTNVHVILEEAPEEPEPTEPARPEQLLVLSARTPAALDEMSRRLADHLEGEDDDHAPDLAADLADTAWTLQVGRRIFEHGRAVVARDRARAAELLRGMVRGSEGEAAPHRTASGARPEAPPPVVFLFPGLGDHYPNMARGLYETEPVFRRELDAAAEAMAELRGAGTGSGGAGEETDLRKVIFSGDFAETEGKADFKALLRRGAPSGDGEADAARSRLTRTMNAQPALFAVEYALARLWMSWGVVPQAMIGYSIGEYVAAALAGVLSLPDALKLVERRARWIEDLPGGSMLAVPLTQAVVEERLAELREKKALDAGREAGISATNGPNLTVVGGTPEAVEAVRESFAGDGVSVLPLEATHAFHTALLDPVSPRLTELAGGVEAGKPTIPYLSNVTGTWIAASDISDPAYWSRHMTGTVRFAEGVAELLADPRRVFLEVGPGGTLTSLVRQHPAAGAATGAGPLTVTSLRHGSEAVPDGAHLLRAAGRLWCAGVEIDWEAFQGGEGHGRRRVVLPGYPFQRRRHWIEAPAAGAQAGLGAAGVADGSSGMPASAGTAAEASADSDGVAPREIGTRPEIKTPFREPDTETEEALAAIWADLFGFRPIGADDSFFDLGGHSLLGIQLMTHVRQRFDVELPLTDLFEYAVLADLARRVEEVRAAGGRAEGEAMAYEPPPIPRLPVPDEGDFPLSFDQERLWFIHRLDPLSSAYNVDGAARLQGPVDFGAFQRSLVRVMERQPTWRTTFPQSDGRPVARVHPVDPGFRVPVVDVSGVMDGLAHEDLQRLVRREVHRPFDIEEGPLVRMTFFRLGPQDHILNMTVHHIVTDWFTFYLLWEEMRRFYMVEAGLEEADQALTGLPELPVRYTDYAVWQREWMSGEVLEGHIDFWREMLAPMPPFLELPIDRPRPPHYTSVGAKVELIVGPERADGLRALSGEEAASLFMTLLGAYAATLMQFSGQEQVVLATPNANRIRPELEPILGFFLTQLTYPLDLGGNPTFRELLRRIRTRSLEAYPYASLPFSKLVEAVRPPRDMSRPPITQTNVLLLDADTWKIDLPGVDSEAFHIDDQAARFELSLALWDTVEGSLNGWIEYNKTLFDRSTAERITRGLEAVMDGLIADPDRPLSALSVLTAPERRQLLAEWSEAPEEAATEAAPQTLPELFLARVAEAPEAVAVEAVSSEAGGDGGETVTYGELARRSARVARALVERGVGPESVVAVVAERSAAAVAAVIGAVRAGAAYLPVDPTYPPERVWHLLDDSGAAAILTAGSLEGTEAGEGIAADPRRLDVDELLAEGLAAGDQPPAAAELDPSNLDPDNRAYVIYTSGSTGRPKGVEVSHRSITHYLSAIRERVPLAPGDRGLAHSPAGFDVSVWQLWAPLASGAAAVLAPPERFTDPAAFAALNARHRVTWLSSVPSQLGALVGGNGAQGNHLAQCRDLRYLCSGGEALPVDLARRVAAAVPRAAFFNLYGPTETTIIATGEEWDEASVAASPPGSGGRVPIGTPLEGMRAVVVGPYLEAVPYGAPGELAVGGPGVARGYVGLPGRTAVSFVPDPWSGTGENGPGASGPGDRLYLTGDRARRRADGRLEFLGRVDRQVKVRGVRIEPGEIEAVLASHPAVERAAAIVRYDMRTDLPGEGDGRLVAYVVPAAAAKQAAGDDGWAMLPEELVEELRSHVAPRLPEAMVPAHWVGVRRLPVTAHGKLDAAALPRPVLSGSAAAAGPAPSWVEERLAAVWSRVLGVGEVGPDDDFFRLGGDSINSIQMTARAREAGIVVEPGQIFQHQTVRELAAVAKVVTVSAAESKPVIGPVAMTPAAARFFAADMPRPNHFNQALLFTADPPLDEAALLRAVRHLALHHDALRLRARRGEDGRWSLEQAAPGPEGGEGAAMVSVLDLTGVHPAARGAAWERAAGDAQAGLDLAEGPLMRLLVGRFAGDDAAPAGSRPEAQRQRLLFIVHHLVVDGLSWRILVEDLIRAYQAAAAGEPVELPAKTASLRDWAETRRAAAASPELDSELDEWARLLGGARAEVPLPELPDAPEVDLERDSEQETGYLDEARTAAMLRDLPGAEFAGVEEILLTALVRALAERRAPEDGARVLLDVESHGRTGSGLDLSRTVGWFTNIHPLAVDAGAALKEEAGAEEVGGGDPASVPALLREVRAALAAVPGDGSGYGLLRYLSGDPTVEARMAALPRARIAFNYLGRIGVDGGGATGNLRLSDEVSGAARSPENPRHHPLEASAVISGGGASGERVLFSLAYSGRRFAESDVEALLADWKRAVEELVDRGLEHKRAGELSDFGWQAGDLAAIEGAIGDALGDFLDDE